MAQFKKTYPLTKSTLTINYPKGLVSVIDDPKKYLSRTSWDQDGVGDSYYPDVIVVPENGSFINAKMTFKRKVTIFMNDNGSEELLTEEPETTEEVIEPFGGEEMFWHEDSTQKKYICSVMLCFTPISVLNHAEWQLQHDKADGGGWYLRHKYDITIDIKGKPKFFSSNATKYFCHGLSETDPNGKARFGMWNFGYKPIGWVGVSESSLDSAKFIDIKLVDIGKFVEKKCANKTLKYSKMETRTLGTSGQNRLIPRSDKDYSEKPEDEEKLAKCQGCFYQMGLVNPSPTGRGTYKIKGKYVTIGNDQIVAVQLYPPGRTSGYIQLMGKISEEEDENLAGTPKLVVNKTNDTFKMPVNFPYLNYYLKNGEKIFHIRSEDIVHMLTSMKLTNKVGLAFNKYFTSNTFSMYGSPFYWQLLRTELPYFQWGISIFPIFTSPLVSYLKLNCTRAADPRNVLGNEDTDVNIRILNAIDIYGMMVDKKNVDSYPNGQQTVIDELKALKNSKSKFKILYVNCHGGKYSDTDQSYGALDDPPRGKSVIFDYRYLKSLLQGRTRADEYYFVHFSSCFGGGFCENQVHNNSASSNYTVTTASPELGERVLIWYNDCANSPAWVGPRVLGDLFNLYGQGVLASSESYSTQIAKINQLVTQGRQKNVQLLVNFMKNNYQFITQMMDMSKFQWTQQTYNDSITYAGNLLVLSSREDDDGVALGKKYPIVYIFNNMVNAITSEGTAVSPIPITPDIDFIKFTTDPEYCVPIINKFMNVNRNMVKRNELIYLNPSTYNMIKSNPMKTKLKRYFMFFKNLYVTCCQMDINTQPVQKLNGVWNYMNRDGQKKGYALSWMLDDTPGIIDRCGGDYGAKTWPFCPGLDENSGFDRDFVKVMTFTRKPVGEET